MQQTYPRRWLALIVLALVQFMIVADNTIANVALPSVQADLDMPTDHGAWVINGYLLTAGGLVLLGGRLTDLLGRRRLFVIGTVVFAASSLACGLAPGGGWLIVARFVQGCGEALASPAALSLIAVMFTDSAERGKALGVWGGLSGLGATAGVLLSGILTDTLGWRWIFYINLPIAAAALLFTSAALPADRPRDRTAGPVDIPGAALVTGGVTALVYGLLASAEHGWTDPLIVAAMLVGAAALTAFVVVQRRAPLPLVPRGFFTNRVRVGGNLAAVFLIGVMAALFLLLTLYLQQVRAYSPLRSGLAYLPFCIIFVAAIGLSFLITARIGSRATLLTAFASAAAGMLWLSRLTPQSSYQSELLPALLVLAVGFGLGFPGLQIAALHRLTDTDAGLGAGVQTAVQALANALGIAVFLSIALHVAGPTGDPTAGYAAAFLASVVGLALGAAIVVFTIPRRLDTATAAAEESGLSDAPSGVAGPDRSVRSR
ncbi:MFS transporter [Micromonospora sp. DT31]|uniref:MFS transporter n=1 Tax=Micromonospora sp. DT31 TaxID=3393434 RepID=UPI003CEBE60B